MKNPRIIDLDETGTPVLTAAEQVATAEWKMGAAPDPTRSPRPSDSVEPLPTGGPPAQLDRAALRGVAGEIVGKILPHTEACEAALLFNLLAAFGSQAGRNCYTYAGNSRHYPNLFGVLVGTTGKGRKGTSWNCCKAILEQTDEEWTKKCVAKGLHSGEGLIYHVRDGRADGDGEPKDPGVSDKRLFVIEEEFSAVLKRMRGKENSLAAILRDAWDGNDLRSLVKNKPDRATAPHISVVAHITKAEASDLLTGTDCQNGFANRFDWVYTGRSKLLPDAGPIPMGPLRREIEALKNSLKLATDGEEREIPLSPDAKELWRAKYDGLSEGMPGLFGSVIGRAEPQVRRLALVYSMIEGETITSIESLRAALALWRYCQQTAGWLFGTPLNHPDADRIYEALRHRPDGMTRTEINRELFQNHAGASRLDEAFAVLEKAGAAHPIREKTGGADRERWILTGGAK